MSFKDTRPVKRQPADLAYPQKRTVQAPKKEVVVTSQPTIDPETCGMKDLINFIQSRGLGDNVNALHAIFHTRFVLTIDVETCSINMMCDLISYYTRCYRTYSDHVELTRLKKVLDRRFPTAAVDHWLHR